MPLFPEPCGRAVNCPAHIHLLRTPRRRGCNDVGRSPDLRVNADLAFPGDTQWRDRYCSPSTVAGAVSFCERNLLAANSLLVPFGSRRISKQTMGKHLGQVMPYNAGEYLPCSVKTLASGRPPSAHDFHPCWAIDVLGCLADNECTTSRGSRLCR